MGIRAGARRWLAGLIGSGGAVERRRTGGPGGLGERGERLAEQALRAEGMRIVGRHVRMPHGEIDLIAQDRGTWVFIEVKTRGCDQMEKALGAVTPEKQRRLTRLALAYMKRHRLLNSAARFDVVGITWSDSDLPPIVQHIRDAFEPTGIDGMFS